MPVSSFPRSVFDRIFDVAVCGAGVIGYAAALSLAAGGRQVLLVDAGGDLLWEVTRALENRVGDLSGSNPWTEWIKRLEERQGVRDGFFDGALAETLVASELENAENLSVLLYAMPVAVELGNGAITVATKSGPRRLRARQWVDATEMGLLTQSCLTEPANFRREPAAYFRSLVLQSAKWDDSEAKLYSDGEWLSSVRESEHRFRWPVWSGVSWEEDVLKVVRGLRESVATPFLISHASARDYPIYAASAASLPLPVPANLLVLSPAFTHDSVNSLAERFLLGASAAERLAALPSVEPMANSTPVNLPEPVEERTAQVLVAGTGTAGVLAALAAAGQNTDTLAIDSATFPGGIGTEAGISKYCQGLPGGMQSQLDEFSAEFSRLLVGGGSFGAHWHPLGKRLAILKLFTEAGVRFQGDTVLCGVKKNAEGRVESVLVAVDGRLTRLRAPSFIDSTGDGDLCALAGAEFTMGRPEDGVCLSFSQVGFALRKTEDGFSLIGRNYDAGWADPTDPEDLTRARLRGLAQYLRPIWTDAGRPFALASSIGLRQSRQIQTDLAVTFADLINGATFGDSIGGALTFADTHAVDFEFETDDSLFYYWICQAFRELLRCELPYRMLLPRGLTNVWIACRAAGIDGSATYGIRMQRDMQRLGEAAGYAAVLAGESGDSRRVDLAKLQSLLRESGACAISQPPVEPDVAELKARLENGRPGFHFWHVYRQPEKFRETVEALLNSADPAVSFHAAAVLAMWQSAKAEARLITAIRDREAGPEPSCGKGAFAQDVDIPYWLLAVVLLRRVGSNQALPALRELAAETNLPFNVRTCLALTLERVMNGENADQVIEILDQLAVGVSDVAKLPPTRSVRRMIEGNPQLVLGNATGADTNEDQSWQLYLILARARNRWGRPLPEAVPGLLADPRSYVRRAFNFCISAT